MTGARRTLERIVAARDDGNIAGAAFEIREATDQVEQLARAPVTARQRLRNRTVGRVMRGAAQVRRNARARRLARTRR